MKLQEFTGGFTGPFARALGRYLTALSSDRLRSIVRQSSTLSRP
jgi:hypothetical protein